MAPAAPAQRDRYVDLLRAASICVVVLGHWTVSSVTLSGGELGYANLLDVQPVTHPLTWVFQVMPVFFLVGGYANAASLASPRRGTTAAWIRRRALRLLRPSIVLMAAVLTARLLAVPLGADVELVRTATWAAVTPLWFLVVYLAVVLLAPLAEVAHRRWGLRVVVALVATVAIGDVARLVSGDVAPAAGNYLFGWLAVHQAGFAWRDGRLPTTPARQWGLMAGGLGTALLLVGPGPYGVAMVGAATPPGLTNTASPTLALLALATAQLGAVLLLRGPGTAWVSRPDVWAVVVRINLRILTVFL
ncbi:MAG: acyltransferase family protein, partial [Actinomycetota bacterium]